MSDLGVTVATGLALGVAYGVLGAAVSLVWVATRTLHLALGAVLVAGVVVRLLLGLEAVAVVPPPLAIGAGVAVAAAASALLEPLVLRPLRRGAPWLIGLVVAGVVIETALGRVVGARTFRPEPVLDLGEGLGVAGVAVSGPVVAAMVVGTPLVLALSLVVARTRFGRSLRLVGGSEAAAALIGIPPRRVRAGALALAGATAAVGGLLVAPIGTVGVTQSDAFTLRAVAAAAVFGVVGPGRAVLGGLLLGAVEAAAQHAVPALPGDVAIGLVVVAVLALAGDPSRRRWGRAW